MVITGVNKVVYLNWKLEHLKAGLSEYAGFDDVLTFSFDFTRIHKNTPGKIE